MVSIQKIIYATRQKLGTLPSQIDRTSQVRLPRTPDLIFFNFGALPNFLHYITDRQLCRAQSSSTLFACQTRALWVWKTQ